MSTLCVLCWDPLRGGVCVCALACPVVGDHRFRLKQTAWMCVCLPLRLLLRVVSFPAAHLLFLSHLFHTSHLTPLGHPQIRFARVSGFPRLFVSNDGVPASPSHHVAASCADDSASSIVTAHCPDTSVGCTLRLTVVGDDAVETAYTAQATTTNDPVVLTTGWPSGGTLTPGQYAHFTWAAPAASNGQLITFTLTSLAGDPDLFVSCTSVPSNGHATWSSRMIQDDQVSGWLLYIIMWIILCGVCCVLCTVHCCALRTGRLWEVLPHLAIVMSLNTSPLRHTRSPLPPGANLCD